MSQYNGTAEEDMPRAAVAVLHGTEGNDDVSATIRFTPEDGGLAYTTEAEGLEPGEHGYHIHLYGDCSAADGTSAGTHFNLEGSSKNPPEDIDRITGDLGNLDVGDDGTAEHDGMIEGASLTGAKAIIGRGIIIHEKANDPDQPRRSGSRQRFGRQRLELGWRQREPVRQRFGFGLRLVDDGRFRLVDGRRLGLDLGQRLERRRQRR